MAKNATALARAAGEHPSAAKLLFDSGARFAVGRCGSIRHSNSTETHSYLH